MQTIYAQWRIGNRAAEIPRPCFLNLTRGVFVNVFFLKYHIPNDKGWKTSNKCKFCRYIGDLCRITRNDSRDLIKCDVSREICDI